MKTAVIAASCLAGASAFTGVPVSVRAPAHARGSASGLRMADEMSASLPFLKKPKNLDGLIGNVGFDPAGLAECFPVPFLVEAELKNGRVAMLAVVGWLVSEIIHIPGDAYAATSPLEAFTRVGASPLLQIFVACGIAEFHLHKGKVTMENMFEDTSRVPGEFKLDPLGVSKDPKKLAQYKLSEVKHGRLAMFAIMGLIGQSLVGVGDFV